ncbi:uroporphyrinogen-III synthase, partial [Halobacillus sp. BBL2006]
MKGLTGKRIGVAADRKSDAICRLIQNMGGTAAVFPSQGRQRLNEETSIKNIKDYLDTRFEWVILTTGIGAKTLAHSASNIGLKD